MLGTRRRRRYDKLSWHDIFLPFEARPLSIIPFSKDSVPYMSKLIRERRHMKAMSDKLGRSREAWRASIYELYRTNGWVRKDKLGRVIYLPFRMVKDFEDRYRAKHPEYDSPWEKRPRKMKDFIDKINRTLRNQAQREFAQRQRARGVA